MMRVPGEVSELLAVLLDGIESILEGNLLAVYPNGSLTLDGFDPQRSDIDLVVVSEKPICDEEFTDLSALHRWIRELDNPYSDRIELTYIDREAFKRYEPGHSHPTLNLHAELSRVEHRSNWILDRRMIREKGTSLKGPDPKSVIDPISDAQVREAVTGRLDDWLDWAEDPEDPDWSLGIGHKR